ncbi:restriction endonuclease subunit S [Oscillatoria laete-virens NRMC-F 0139]|nr:restriction endonuclease subunit S [Oscillatoria laete-virens]MDL5053762.1 restriction endonuclease subunit S [Oscillatoria laete-virens NRMC-F 0139]
MITTEAKKLPNSWHWVSLGEVCSVHPGQHVLESDYNHKGIGVGYLTGPTDFREVYPLVTKWAEKPKAWCKPGDVLVTVKGAGVGKANLAPREKVAIGRQLMAIRPKPELIDQLFVFWLVITQFSKLQADAQGATVPGLTRDDIESLQVPLPPLAEQKRIAAIAQKADRLRRTRRYALQLSDTYLRSVFLEMFGDPSTNPKRWAKSTVEEISTQVTDGEHTTPERTLSGIKLLSARNIQNGYIEFKTGLDYIPEYEYQRIKKRCNPEVGDVLMSCSGSIGRVTTVDIKEPFSLVRSVALIKPNHVKIFSKYLEHYLRTDYSQYLINQSAHQSSQANIFTGQIKELPILLPPLPLQEKFAQIVQKFERLRTQQREAERQAEHLFQTLLHRAFRGELTSQDSNDEPASVLLEQIGAQQAQAEAKQQDAEAIQLNLPGIMD